MGLYVPHVERRVEHGDRPAAQLLVDGSDPIVLAASRGLTQLPVRARRVAGIAAPDTFEVRATTTPSAARRCRSSRA